ncbi:MAG: Thiol:disulfide interchange protein DsbD [Phycisphaerae bacterium]|nr:Thiol:disulfide interchange protein DsbD [Phycisphaerae bacterium]
MSLARSFALRLLWVAPLAAVVALGQDGPPAAESPAPKTTSADPKAQAVIYDETADGRKQIEQALAAAKRDNTRVLVMFGGNWCGWCHKLHALFRENAEIGRTLLYEYQLVMIDIGKWNKHMELAAGFDADVKKNGVPFLTVLDAEGKVLTNQETGSLEAGEKHDPAKVRAFLEKWKATAWNADEVVKAALAKASADGKTVFLHLGAPWCGWCRKLDAFLARPEIAGILGEDFIEAKVDVDRMTNGKEVAARYRKDNRGGIPWIAFLDGAGNTVITSDGPKGNTGHPASADEISHFATMLNKVRKHMSADDVKRIEQALAADAAVRQRSAP